MAIETIKVPDLGGADAVEVIEITVGVGDEVGAEDSLLVLESDKASMDVPSPSAGVVKKILVKVGDQVSDGTPIVEMDVADDEADSAEDAGTPEAEDEQHDGEGKEAAPEDSDQDTAADSGSKPAAAKGGGKQTVKLPDLGTDDEVDVIEIAVSAGDAVSEGDTLMTLESDKATMDVPSPYTGTVTAISVKEGAKVKSGDTVGEMEVEGASEPEPETRSEETVEPAEAPRSGQPAQDTADNSEASAQSEAPSGSADNKLDEQEAPADEVYAGPMVRQFAREIGVDLRNVKGSGAKGRITREDVQSYVKKALSRQTGGAGAATGAIPAVPDVDYAQFGEIEEVPLSRIAKLTAANMARTWLNVPAVTQFDDADITELEDFRKGLKSEAEKRGVKLTPVAFLMLACARALQAHPVINRSWHSSGERVIQKKFVHIGMAVDTPRGLLVPVIRDVDKKGLWQLAEETAEMAQKARDGKLSANDMQGGGFSISSLGALGGTGFTPIVNTPEAAILGVSRASMQPVWNGKEFVPRQMLPLSLTYDHRLINGAAAGKFMTDLVAMIGDIRRLLL
ncbi:MAG: dihydrolipoyllysine-residue acetyltransferase [Porticoccaceae bacterium]|nr:dihydrolipoyllysine-residue acetyltransferase [Porticoccaceae bacterium]